MIQHPRILHVISRLDGYGGARTLRQVATHQATAGRRPTVAALSADASIAAELVHAGAAVHMIGRRWRADPLAFGRLAAWRRGVSCDVVHAWDLEALAYARLTDRRKPLVAAWDAGRPVAGWMMALSDRTAQLRPGVDPIGPSSRDRAAVFAELGLAAEARLIAIAGPLVREKALDEAIWCFELVRVLHPTARLVLFGDGPDRPRLERYAELVSEPDCVQFAGYRADMGDLLPHADVYWQLDPSRNTSHSLLEALSAGVPVVASDVPGHRAAITPGETGQLVALGSRADAARATDHLLADSALATRIGQAGADAVRRHWTVPATVAACDSLYKHLAPGQ